MGYIDEDFKRMNRLFWGMFAVAATLILAVWIMVGVSFYTVATNPAAVGNAIAAIVGPIADAIKE